MKHLSEEQLIAYQDGERRAARNSRRTSRSARECRAELDRIAEMLAAFQALPVPDPGEDYGRRVWQQIAPRLAEKRSHWWDVFLEPRRLTRVARWSAALVLVAFLAGRVTRHTGVENGMTGPAAASDAQVRERVLMLAVGEHLGRSEMVLMEIANAGPESGARKAGEHFFAAAARGRFAGREPAVPADRAAGRRHRARQCAG